MKHETRPKGHHEDFASDRPEHVERQAVDCPHGCRGTGWIGAVNDWGDTAALPCPLHSKQAGFPPETGPDTRQPEMVSKQDVLAILHAFWAETPDPAEAELCKLIEEEVHKL